MKLIRQSRKMLGSGPRMPTVWEGKDATEVLLKFQGSSPYFSGMSAMRFRTALIDMAGIDPGPDATDLDFLLEMVRVDPSLTLEQTTGTLPSSLG